MDRVSDRSTVEFFTGAWDANTGVTEPRVPPPEVAARHLVAGRTKG